MFEATEAVNLSASADLGRPVALWSDAWGDQLLVSLMPARTRTLR